MTTYEIEEKIVAMLKTVYDPEIPVNVYDLGLIYKIDVTEHFDATINLVFEPEWDKEMMTDEAKLELGFL